MKNSSTLVRILGVILSGALLLGVTACETASTEPTGPVGPTVKVSFDAPSPAVVEINTKDVGVTPTTANVEVDEKGQLLYTVTIVFDASKTMGGSSGNQRGSGENLRTSGTVTWPQGKIPPAKLTFVNGIGNESREFAPANPPGTRPSFARRD